MANKKITELPDIGIPDNLDILEIVDVSTGVSKHVKTQNLRGDLSGFKRDEFIWTSGAQNFVLSENYNQVYSVAVQGQGPLHSSQYSVTFPNVVTILDPLDVDDYIIVLYSTAPVGILPYYTQGETDDLLADKEDIINKTDNIEANKTSSIIYTSAKSIVTWIKTWLVSNLLVKTTLVNADNIVIGDSEDGYDTKKITWLNFKATIKTYLDTLYTPLARTLKINGVEQNLNANREWQTAQASTGALTYGGCTIASTTTVNIGACTGLIVDNETNPNIPTYQYVNYAGQTGVTVPTIGSGTATYVLLKMVLGVPTIHFQNTAPTSDERKEMIYLSKLSHPASTVLTIALDEVDFITSPLQQFRDLMQAFNYVNTGLTATANANLTFSTNAASILGDGINFVADNTKPNHLAVAPQNPCIFLPLNQSGAAGAATTTIDPTLYDVGGVTTTIPGSANQATIKYLYYSPGVGFGLQRGQTIYSTITDAIAAVNKETFVVRPNLVTNAIRIGAWVTTKGCTNLSNTTTARFFPADMFGQLGGSTSGISVGTLQTGYNNSTHPEILTDSTHGAVTFRRGSAADTDNVIEGQNGAGTNTYSVDGNGNVTANTFVKSGGTSSQYLMADGSISTDLDDWTLTGTNTQNATNGTVIHKGLGTTSVTKNTSFRNSSGSEIGYVDDAGNISAGASSSGYFYGGHLQFPTAGGDLIMGGSGQYFRGTSASSKWESNIKLKYASDLSATYDDRTLIDKGYAFARYGSTVDSTTTALSLSTLNSTYSTVEIGHKVICMSISGGALIYVKTGASTWASYSVNNVT